MSAAAASASSLPKLEKYELLEEIGHGGMATVYRARDKRLGREVAVKVIHRHLRENMEVGARFLAEARAVAKLRHPGIVEVFDVGADEGGERYLVVELVRGSTLRKVLKEHREMPAEVGAAIVLELCEALEHAHAASIVHRDIKPENVLIELPQQDTRDAAPPSCDEPNKRSLRKQAGVIIKITDFGIAKILDAQGVTSTGQVLGSPAHMAPEQIEGAEVDARTDVFALGVLMYECLVGHLPFEGQNPAQVLRKVLEGIYMPADRERPSVGGRWSRIIAEALAREPADRTSTPAALAEQITEELNALGLTDPKAEVVAYFADPEGYREALPGRLVPRLVERGEQARAKGNIAGAAADFNRALSLRPNDPAIMKRIAQLGSSASRRQMLRRVGAIVVGSVVLGLSAFGVARAFKARHTEVSTSPSSKPSTEIAALPFPRPPAKDTASAAPSAPPDHQNEPPSASGVSSAGLGPPRVKITLPASAVPHAGPPSSVPHKVKFVVNPLSAKLSVDGQPVPNWFSSTLPLSPGAHEIAASVEGSKCCKPLRASRVVEPVPADKPDHIQTILVSLDLLPATVTLVGAPPNGQVSCPSIKLNGFAGSSRTVELNEAIWNGRCLFVAPDRASRELSVSLRAGEANVISWPRE